jgi:apolipoprotein D and lipocalin family protein
MNPSLPAKPLPADAEDDLESRILQVEQRLIAREQRLRQGVAGLGKQLRHRWRRRKQLLLPVAGGLLAVAALLALSRRPAASRPAAEASRRRMELPWRRLIGLAWPLLPAAWRERVSPGTAGGLLTLGLPLVEALLGARRREAAPLRTVSGVDLARLSGRWFVVGELAGPSAGGTPEAPELGLLPRDDGQLDLLMRHGRRGSEAVVQPVPESQGARFRISHWPEALRWLPLAWAEYGVLHVDPAYEEAVIGSVGRDALWLLSRRPGLPQQRREALAGIAADNGFAVDKLRCHGAD